MLNALLASAPDDTDALDAWVGSQVALASLDVRRDRRPEALARLKTARGRAQALVAFDPENQRWQALAAKVDAAVAYFHPTS